jgi:hypothetical protein
MPHQVTDCESTIQVRKCLLRLDKPHPKNPPSAPSANTTDRMTPCRIQKKCLNSEHSLQVRKYLLRLDQGKPHPKNRRHLVHPHRPLIPPTQ